MLSEQEIDLLCAAADRGYYFAHANDLVFGVCESLMRRGYMFARTSVDPTAPTEFYVSDAGMDMLGVILKEGLCKLMSSLNGGRCET